MESCFNFFSSVCVVLGFIGVALIGLWFLVRRQFDGPDIDWAALNASNELD